MKTTDMDREVFWGDTQVREDDRLVERFTERTAERRERLAAMVVDAETEARIRRALGMDAQMDEDEDYGENPDGVRFTKAHVAKMRAAFMKVQNAEHWKKSIDKVISLNDAEKALLMDAIPFFTGSVPTFQRLGTQRDSVARIAYRVQAAGYYAAIGS